ncbi:FAD binding domain-containing protein [Microbacterium sp.]|uniref:FAD binding domain-containing protein n=1 Tax=Microbacterium sp. TaxID=51671 RepID=UPI003A889FD0
MDITTVRHWRTARSRADLTLAAGETFLAGGSWLMSEPQPEVTGFVDLTSLGWDDLDASAEGLRIGATCTIARLVAGAQRLRDTHPHWTALPMVADAANALLASFKIWNTATVGGNICRAFSAGAMVSLAAALDGVAEVWTPAGADRRVPVADLVTGNGSTVLARGEALRAVFLPAAALRSQARLRKIALAEHGRSGAVVTGRIDPDGGAVFTVTAATEVPAVFRFAALPDAEELSAAVASAPHFFTDPLGAADWRRGVSIVLAERIRRDLITAARR